jgi:hypothetical protein
MRVRCCQFQLQTDSFLAMGQHPFLKAGLANEQADFLPLNLDTQYFGFCRTLRIRQAYQDYNDYNLGTDDNNEDEMSKTIQFPGSKHKVNQNFIESLVTIQASKQEISVTGSFLRSAIAFWDAGNRLSDDSLNESLEPIMTQLVAWAKVNGFDKFDVDPEALF